VTRQAGRPSLGVPAPVTSPPLLTGAAAHPREPSSSPAGEPRRFLATGEPRPTPPPWPRLPRSSTPSGLGDRGRRHRAQRAVDQGRDAPGTEPALQVDRSPDNGPGRLGPFGYLNPPCRAPILVVPAPVEVPHPDRRCRTSRAWRNAPPPGVGAAAYQLVPASAASAAKAAAPSTRERRIVTSKPRPTWPSIRPRTGLWLGAHRCARGAE
jgi:hypothetical protein